MWVKRRRGCHKTHYPSDHMGQFSGSGSVSQSRFLGRLRVVPADESLGTPV